MPNKVDLNFIKDIKDQRLRPRPVRYSWLLSHSPGDEARGPSFGIIACAQNSALLHSLMSQVLFLNHDKPIQKRKRM